MRGSEPGVDARFQRISLEGTVETPMSQQDLDRIAEQASQGVGLDAGVRGLLLGHSRACCRGLQGGQLGLALPACGLSCEWICPPGPPSHGTRCPPAD